MVLSLHIDLLFSIQVVLVRLCVVRCSYWWQNSIVVRRLAMRERVPRSGPGHAVLMKMFGIDSTAIIKAVKEVAKELKKKKHCQLFLSLGQKHIIRRIIILDPSLYYVVELKLYTLL